MRTVEALDFEWHGEELHMIIRGNGFLYNMVRIMAGTLIAVGQGKIKPDEIIEIIESKKRERAGVTAEPQGLTLQEIYYDFQGKAVDIKR